MSFNLCNTPKHWKLCFAEGRPNCPWINWFIPVKKNGGSLHHRHCRCFVSGPCGERQGPVPKGILSWWWWNGVAIADDVLTKEFLTRVHQEQWASGGGAYPGPLEVQMFLAWHGYRLHWMVPDCQRRAPGLRAHICQPQGQMKSLQ